MIVMEKMRMRRMVMKMMTLIRMMVEVSTRMMMMVMMMMVIVIMVVMMRTLCNGHRYDTVDRSVVGARQPQTYKKKINIVVNYKDFLPIIIPEHVVVTWPACPLGKSKLTGLCQKKTDPRLNLKHLKLF